MHVGLALKKCATACAGGVYNQFRLIPNFDKKKKLNILLSFIVQKTVGCMYYPSPIKEIAH